MLVILICVLRLNTNKYQRLCAKRSFAFKVRKEKWLSRPKETSLHTVSQVYSFTLVLEAIQSSTKKLGTM